MKKKNFIKIAKEVIDLEIKALTKLKKSFDNSFNLAVEQILKCKSKVILCGVGKSGLIANKRASTISKNSIKGCFDINKTKAIIANTIKGKGFSFSENNNEWHHAILTRKMYEKGLEELKNGN